MWVREHFACLQGTIGKEPTTSVIIRKLNFGEAFIGGTLLITSEGVYGFAKTKYTGRRHVTTSMQVTNITNFDTKITGAKFAVTFNGYLVDYASKREYVNESFPCFCSLFLGASQ